jgi:hypothetical protein
MPVRDYSSLEETKRIFDYLCSLDYEPSSPGAIQEIRKNVEFFASRDAPYFPIPFKETEVTSALKGIEGSLASALWDTRGKGEASHKVNISLEKATAFLFQAYIANVGGYGKLDPEAKKFLKGH